MPNYVLPVGVIFTAFNGDTGIYIFSGGHSEVDKDEGKERKQLEK